MQLEKWRCFFIVLNTGFWINLPTADRSLCSFCLANNSQKVQSPCVSDWVFCSRKNILLCLKKSWGSTNMLVVFVGWKQVTFFTTDRFIPHGTASAGGIRGDSVKLKGFSKNSCSFSHTERVMALINIHLNSWRLYLEHFLIALYAVMCLLQKSSFRDGIGEVSKGHWESLCPRSKYFLLGGIHITSNLKSFFCHDKEQIIPGCFRNIKHIVQERNLW